MSVILLRCKNLFLITIGLFFIYSPSVKSFEVDQFKSGMTQKEVKEILSTQNFDKIQDKGKCIFAFDLPQKNTNRRYSFCFYQDGKLNLLEKDFPPSMKNFIALFDKFTSFYGKPFDYLSRITIENHDLSESREIAFMWRTQTDTIELKYIVFSTNDQLKVMYKVGWVKYIK